MVVRIILIILLNILWISIMVGTLIIPTMPQFLDDDAVNAALEVILCNPGETLRRQQTSNFTADNFDISLSITSQCKSTTAETNRNVTDRLVVIGLVGTGIAFLVSTMAEIAFAISLFRKRVKQTGSLGSGPIRQVSSQSQPQ
jgi:hypothetical protein